MLAFGVRYLNGFSVAALPDDRAHAEWPPHPGRVFMALAAAHFETGADPDERAALEWLEAVEPAPSLFAADGTERAVVTQYVPVNDKTGPATALMRDLPLARDRQPRTFARRYLEDDVVYVAWLSVDPPVAVRNALSGLCAKVTRIGHSSSLVQTWMAGQDEVPQPNWVPAGDRATLHLRIAAPGTFAELERRYNQAAIDSYFDLLADAEQDSDPPRQKAAKKRLRDDFGNTPPPRLRPQLSAYEGYARPSATEADKAPGTVFSPHAVVLALEPEDSPYKYLDLASVLTVIGRWRDAILSRSDGLSDRVRGLLSGHNADGTPLDGPHLAFMPLAFVGHEHADGRLLGVGLTLPSEISAAERREALRAIAGVRHLALGRLGTWRLVPETSSLPPWNLRAGTWTAYPDGATHWATVTPVVFDRHPKATARGASMREAAEMIATACTRIGLPVPREVIVTHVSAHLGVPPAFAFPRLRRKDGSERRHVHAILVFDTPLCGPMLIGAGRFRGYGFFRALE